MSLFAESPSMPSMPSMPTISSPSVNKSGTQKNNSSTKTEKTQSAKTSSNITAQSLLQMSSSNSLSSITDLASVLSGVSSENATEDDLKRINSFAEYEIEFFLVQLEEQEYPREISMRSN